jgi:antitoxin Phd
MSKQYSIAEARDHLPGIIHEVESDGPVELTRRGKPVAVVVSIPEYQRLSSRKPGFVDAVDAWRQSLTPEELEELDVDGFLEGIRDSSPGRDFQW